MTDSSNSSDNFDVNTGEDLDQELLVIRNARWSYVTTLDYSVAGQIARELYPTFTVEVLLFNLEENLVLYVARPEDEQPRELDPVEVILIRGYIRGRLVSLVPG
jgi:hypothetical protein